MQIFPLNCFQLISGITRIVLMVLSSMKDFMRENALSNYFYFDLKPHMHSFSARKLNTIVTVRRSKLLIN